MCRCFKEIDVRKKRLVAKSQWVKGPEKAPAWDKGRFLVLNKAALGWRGRNRGET